MWTRSPSRHGKKEFAAAVATRSFKEMAKRGAGFGIADIAIP